MSPERSSLFFVSGGTLPVNSPSYIERIADRILFDSLIEARYCYVLNSRQIGKSSLSVHALSRLRAAGVRTVYLDLTRIGGKNVTAEQWYMGLALEFAHELKLRKELVAYWTENASIGPMQRFFGALRHVMMASPSGEPPVAMVVFIDEIDAVKGLPFEADEFFAGIRECFNQRVFDPVYDRITFCLIGVAVPGDLIENAATTPFNIGERIPLEDFTLAELQRFGKGFETADEEVLKRIHYWTAGHPFLSQSICRALTEMEGTPSKSDVDKVVERELFDRKIRASNVNLNDVANIALHYGDSEHDSSRFRADLLSTYQRILAGKVVADDESNREIVVLKLSGIVKTDGKRLYVRNRIYCQVFDRTWIEENMPGQELRRRQQSYRQGVIRTALVSGAVLATVAVMAFYMWRSRQEVEKARNDLAYQLYVSDMNSLAAYVDKGDSGRVEATLERHQNSPYRGFEWGYWLACLHDAPEEYTFDYKAPGKQEEGHISRDGKEICIVDQLTNMAVVVNRETRAVVGSYQLDLVDRVVAMQDRFAIIRRAGTRWKAVDLKTGKHLAAIGDEPRTSMALPREHSDYIGSYEDSSVLSTIHWLGLWDTKTGERALSLHRPEGFNFDFWHSVDGRFCTYCYLLPGGSLKRYIVYDRILKQEVDRYDLDQKLEFVGSSKTARWTLWGAIDSQTLLRDRVTHQTTSWTGPSSGSQPSIFLSGDSSLVTFIGDGKVAITDFPAHLAVAYRSNIAQIQEGAETEPGQFLASATSVRVYNVKQPGIPQVVAHGFRVTHHSPGYLNLFTGYPLTIEKGSESDFRWAPSFPVLAGIPDYTYNGRWSVSADAKGSLRRLVSSEGAYPPRILPIAPAISAGGIDPDYFACWGQTEARLLMMSVRTGKILWKIENFSDTKSLWISPNGKRLFVARGDLSLEIYDTANGRRLTVLKPHNAGSVTVTFAANGARFFTCGGDGRAVLWDTNSLERLREFQGNILQSISCADLSPDGKRVVTASRSGSWQLWDATTGVQLMDIPASKQGLTTALFLSDGKRIITAGDDNLVRLWPSLDTDPTMRLSVAPSLLAKLHH